MFPAIGGGDATGATATTAGTAAAAAAAATVTTAGVHPLASLAGMRTTMKNGCIPTHQGHWFLKKIQGYYVATHTQGGSLLCSRWRIHDLNVRACER